MKFLISFIFIFLFVSCKQETTSSNTGSNTPNIPPVSVNVLIQPYIDSFESLYQVDIDFSVTFDTDNATGGNTSLGSTVGVCRTYTSGRREVLVNKTWWDSQSNLNRKILIYHELGHCKFNRDHDYELDSSGNRICLTTNANGECTEYKYRTFSGNPSKPISMMYPVINPISSNYNSDTNYYNYELKNPKPQSWETPELSSWNTAYSNYVSSLAIQDDSYSVYALSDEQYIETVVPQDTETNIRPKYTNEGCVEHIDDL